MQHSSPAVSLPTRRTFIASAVATSVVFYGCKKPSTEPATAATARRDVPLRVLLCGNGRWAEVMKTAWSGIAEQPLQITLLNPAVIDADAWPTQCIEALKRCDVAIVPSGLLPAIDTAAVLTPPADSLLGPNNLRAEGMFPVLREGAMKYGGRTVAVALGAVQAAVVRRTDGLETDVPTDWDAFLELAKQLHQKRPEIAVAEPLTGGAAAKMFLWRLNTANPPTWLFDRESFAPVIDTQPYVTTLTTMKACADCYRGARLSAGEVWSQVASGKLQMAIAWPAVLADTDRIEEPRDCEFSSLPSTVEKSSTSVHTLVDYESPVALISSVCRQSDAAVRFVTWLAGGEGTSMIRSAVTGLTELRREAVDSSHKTAPVANKKNEVASSKYAVVLEKSLSSLSIRTPLQLLHYRKYADVLDAAVLACLDGQQTPQTALAMAAKLWADLNQQIGIESQSKVWRRAQGLRN